LSGRLRSAAVSDDDFVRLDPDLDEAGKVDAVARLVSGRPVTPDSVLGADADCEALLDFLIAVYLGRDDFCAVIVEDVMLDRLSHDKKLEVLTRLLRRHGVTEAPYATLVADLRKLRAFRNLLAHTVAPVGDPLHRTRRRGGQNVPVEVTVEEVADNLDRAMRCASALLFLGDLRTRPVAAEAEG